MNNGYVLEMNLVAEDCFNTKIIQFWGYEEDLIKIVVENIWVGKIRDFLLDK